MQAADRAARIEILKTAAFAAGSATAFALSFPLSANWTQGWALSFAWPALLAGACACACSARTLAVIVSLAFFPAFLAHEWWMHEVTVLGMPLLVAYLTAWTAVLALLCRMLAGTRGRRGLPWCVALPLAVVAIEFLRGDLVCSGYAWFFLAHPLVEWTEVAQAASLGGGWLLTALGALVAGGVADAFVARRGYRVASPALAVLALAAVALWGSHRISSGVPRSEGAAADRWEALVVQTNLPMSNKLAWRPDDQLRDFRAFAELTLDGARRAAADRRAPQVVIWPETTVPGFGFESESIRMLSEEGIYPGSRYLDALQQISGAIGRPLLVGSAAYTNLRVEEQQFRWDRQFNSAYLVDSDGVLGRTDKIFLTPFGETMPVISRWDWLEARLLDLGASGMTFDLEEADAPRAFALGRPDAPTAMQGAVPGRREVTIGVPICFEITAPWASRRIAFTEGRRCAEVLVNISNDGWFGPSEAGRRQHVQVAQLRAVELGTPVIRCANTGFSCVIDRFGRIEEMLPARTAGTLVASVEPAHAVPPAARIGDGVAWAALIAVLVLGAAKTLRSRAVRSAGHLSDPTP